MTRSTPKAVRAAALLIVLGACSAPTPPAPVPPPPQQQPVSPARWVATDGRSAPPIEHAEGTVALDHGRLLVTARGAAPRFARITDDGPLERILAVPSKRGTRLLGVSTISTLFRLDEPLGQVAPFSTPAPRCEYAEVLPGAILCPRLGLVDVETGTVRPAKYPMPVATAVANASEGAALFSALGILVTSDGGATWRFARPARDPRDAYAAYGLRVEKGALLAMGKDGEARIDVATATFGPFEGKPGQAPPPVQPVDVTFDPLALAAAAGASAPDLGPTAGLIAAHGQLSRVDLTTGAVTAVAPLPAAWASAAKATCTARRARDDLWITCPLSGALGVAHADLRRRPLTIDPPEDFAAPVSELRLAPSGGVMAVLRGAPRAEQPLASLLVRQPDGTWKGLASAGAGLREGTRLAGRAGPLADGRAVDLALDPPARFVLLDPAGATAELPALDREVAAVATPIEEDADHRLHAVLRAGEPDRPLFTVVQPITGAAPPATIPMPGARAAVMTQGRGLAIAIQDKDQPRSLSLLASADGGATWGAIPAPPIAFAALSVEGSHADRPNLSVGELGARFARVLRLGWGHGEEGEPPAAPPPAPAAPPTATPFAFLTERPVVSSPDPGRRRIYCAATGNRTEVPSVEEQLPDIKPPAGVRLDGAGTDPSRDWETPMPMGVIVMNGRDGTGAAAPPPARHRLFWSDPTEVGSKGKLHTWTGVLRAPAARGEKRAGAAPPVGWDQEIERIAVRGDRALFALRGPGGRLLVRVRAGGKAETAAVDLPPDQAGSEWNPSVANAALSDADESVAWVAGGVLHAWPAGGAPRALAVVPPEAMVGAPAAEGVPLLALAGSLLYRVVPVPAEPAPGAPQPLLPQDWARVSYELTNLNMPICSAHPEGARFLLSHRWAPVADVFTLPEYGPVNRPVVEAFVAHFGARGACLDGLHVRHRGGQPTLFDRIDLVHGRAERGASNFTGQDREEVTCRWMRTDPPAPPTPAPLPAALAPQQSACDGGDRRACVTLGEALYNGRGVAPDPARALPLFRKACDAGEPTGCVDLGWAHASGTGVDRDGAAAATLFAKACGGSVIVGCVGLGVLHRDGNGVPKDSARAAALFKKACDGGVPTACEMLKGAPPPAR
ncbi:MAG: tetratricopeptide repeat protein [Minicystis sp.]